MSNQPDNQLQLALQDFRNSDDYVDMVFDGLLYHASEWLKWSDYDDVSRYHFVLAVKESYYLN